MDKYTIIVDKPHNYWYNLSPFTKAPPSILRKPAILSDDPNPPF